MTDDIRDTEAWRQGFDEGFASADDWLAQHEDAMAEHGWVKAEELNAAHREGMLAGFQQGAEQVLARLASIEKDVQIDLIRTVLTEQMQNEQA